MYVFRLSKDISWESFGADCIVGRAYYKGQVIGPLPPLKEQNVTK